MTTLDLERAIWKERKIIDELRTKQNRCGPSEVNEWFDLNAAIQMRYRRIYALDDQWKKLKAA